MASRARTFLCASLVAIPCVAFTAPCAAHNGRDAGPSKARAAAAEEKAAPVDIFAGIKVSIDPKTGVRSYVQVGDIPDNPGTGKAFVYDEATMGPGVDYWVQKSLETPPPAYAGPAQNYIPADTRVEISDAGYYDGYGYGYGYGAYAPYGNGRPGRPGHGHGDGPGHGGGGGGGPGHGENGGAIRPPPRAPFSRYSPPAGPPGGGVGSPVYYPFDRAGAGSGAPIRYGGRRG
jgi:hypothetical protein